MFIALLVINESAEAKLNARGITGEEAQELLVNPAVVTRNPHPRVLGSRMLIGRTDGGRVLTLVIQPDEDDPAVRHVMTGWDATATERRTLGADRSS